jgi:hypothetical protein
MPRTDLRSFPADIPMRWLAVAILVFVSGLSGANAGDLVRYSCKGCNKSVELMLGLGKKSTFALVPMICHGKTEVTLVALRAGVSSNPACPGGMERLEFAKGMDCPMCPGSKLEMEVIGVWD